MQKKYYIYILTNPGRMVLYTGVTSDLMRRVYEHKHKIVPGFTSKYNVCILIYYEQYDGVEDAIKREKQIKAGSRQKKVALIEKLNKDWKDLSNELFQ